MTLELVLILDTYSDIKAALVIGALLSEACHYNLKVPLYAEIAGKGYLWDAPRGEPNCTFKTLYYASLFFAFLGIVNDCVYAYWKVFKVHKKGSHFSHRSNEELKLLNKIGLSRILV